MGLSVGTRLGVYEVLGTLGAGGMGEVYRARDTRLQREVALKILPQAFAGDPDRLARFEREARVLASLNHPQIAAIYGVEDAGGSVSLVMELAAGQTLSDRLARGAMPMAEALRAARQIAEALEAAHDKGIVHRDLKPGNVMIDDEGRVKVLDFGLAKAWDSDVSSTPNLSQSPTLMHAGTAAGIILGTAAYMSPEQARGTRVDKRSDIWAFGVVLFEMLSGRRLFAGDTVSDTLAEVLKGDIEWAALPAETPGAIRRVLARCLERDQQRRLRDIGDARLEIEEAIANPLPAAVAGGAVLTRRPARMPWLIACAVCLAVGASAGLLVKRAPLAAPTAHALRFLVRPAGDTVPHVLRHVRISPDGRRIVYADDSSPLLLLRDLSEFESRPLAGTERGTLPFFAPDGESIGFFAEGKIQKISVAGGDPVTIGESPTESPGADWGPDGTIIFSRTWTSGLWRVSSAGGEPVQLTTPDRAKGESAHFWPRFLPDGRHVLFTMFGGKGLVDSKIGLLDLATGKVQALFPGSRATYVSNGEIVFFHLGGYHSIPFDLTALAVRGPARAALEDVRPLNPQGSDENYVDVARDGRLVYIPGRAPRTAPFSRLVWMDRRGRIERLPFADNFKSLTLSPDGRYAGVTRLAGGELQVWIYDLSRGTRDQLTRDGLNFDPSWSPLGDRVAFTSVLHGSFDIRWCPPDGSRPPEVLLATDQDEMTWNWLPDGHSGVFETIRPGTGIDIQSMDARPPGERRMLVSTPLDERGPRVSPDGRWMAWDAAGTLYAARYPEMTNRVQLAVGASGVKWSSGTKEIVYARDGQLWAVPYTVDAKGLNTGSAAALFPLPRGTRDRQGHELTYAISADGARFLFLEDDPAPESPEEIRVVDDGLGELARAAAGVRTSR